MTTLTTVARGFWVELFRTHEYPTDQVKKNLRVMEDAFYIANRLKKEDPDHNREVLLASAALLDIKL